LARRCSGALPVNKTLQFLHLNRCLLPCLPQPITDKLPQAQHRFFNLFHQQKKFIETGFSKLSANHYLTRVTKDSTNYF
jgi:hypothetical protein